MPWRSLRILISSNETLNTALSSNHYENLIMRTSSKLSMLVNKFKLTKHQILIFRKWSFWKKQIILICLLILKSMTKVLMKRFADIFSDKLLMLYNIVIKMVLLTVISNLRIFYSIKISISNLLILASLKILMSIKEIEMVLNNTSLLKFILNKIIYLLKLISFQLG